MFTSAIDQGGPYSVTVTSLPSNPAQNCSIHNGSGTIGTADINNVVVTCTQAGRFAYVVNQGSNTLSAFVIDAASGSLTPVAGSPFASTGTTPVAAVVDPNGTYLYVANNGSKTSRCMRSTTPPAHSPRRERRFRPATAVCRPGGSRRSISLRGEHERQYGRGVLARPKQRTRDRDQRVAICGRK